MPDFLKPNIVALSSAGSYVGFLLPSQIRLKFNLVVQNLIDFKFYNDLQQSEINPKIEQASND